MLPDMDMRALSNSNSASHTVKPGRLGTSDYANRVARPVMVAIDRLPQVWRRLVDCYGYVDVYRAWRAGLSPHEVERRAEISGGFFRMDC